MRATACYRKRKASEELKQQNRIVDFYFKTVTVDQKQGKGKSDVGLLRLCCVSGLGWIFQTE